MEQFYLNKNKIAILGGGPAGIYCALNILFLFYSQNFFDFSIDIFDKGEILRTLIPTGNGRCNISNSISDIKDFVLNYPRGDKFLYSVFSRHFNYDSLDFFNSLGIKTYTEADGRIFPVSQSSKDVRNKMLKKLFSYKNVRFINKKIISQNDLTDYNKIVVAAGSRGVENLIVSFGHKYIKFEKSLCALNILNSIYPKGVSVKTLDGDFVFTDKGISGPLAFKISSINAFSDFPYDIKIKLFNEEKLFQLAELYPKKSAGSIVASLIPRSLAKVIVKDYYKNICEISKSELKQYSILQLTVVSKANVGEIVNAGGINLDDVDKNCKSKICHNLWFCGEILNIDGFCGGFNLQNCWSTGYVVAKDLVSSIMKDMVLR